MLTQQKAFNKVWKKFIVDKAPFAFDKKENICVNLTEKGARCAAASLVPVKTLKSWGKNGGTTGSVDNFLNTQHKLSTIFINKLRTCHDGSQRSDNKKNPRREMKLRLQSLARDFKLIIPK